MLFEISQLFIITYKKNLFEGISAGEEWRETVGTAHMEQRLVRARRFEAVHYQGEGERQWELARCAGTHALNAAFLIALKLNNIADALRYRGSVQ
jgi:hypothetical protein